MASDISNIEVVVYALFRLGGYKKKVHTEEIAYEAYTLAKERYGWRLPRFRGMGLPDKELVRIALMDAAKEKYGRLVEGRAGVESTGKDADGWALTAAGIQYLQANEERIARALGGSHPAVSTVEAGRFLRRIKSQRLYQRFEGTKTIEGAKAYEFTDMLDASPDAPRDVIVKKYQRMQSMAELVGDSSVIEFLTACRHIFSDLLATSAQAKNQ